MKFEVKYTRRSADGKAIYANGIGDVTCVEAGASGQCVPGLEPRNEFPVDGATGVRVLRSLADANGYVLAGRSPLRNNL